MTTAPLVPAGRFTLCVKNWREFQHYGKRRPPWIKLHHGLLDKRAFLQLPVASRALAPLLWLIASEHDGEISDALNEMTFRLRMSEPDAREALAPLLAAGFFSCEHGASGGASAPLAGPLRQTEESRGETKAPLGLSSDSDVETSSPIAARASLAGSAHDVARKLSIAIKRMPT